MRDMEPDCPSWLITSLLGSTRHSSFALKRRHIAVGLPITSQSASAGDGCLKVRLQMAGRAVKRSCGSRARKGLAAWYGIKVRYRRRGWLKPAETLGSRTACKYPAGPTSAPKWRIAWL